MLDRKIQNFEKKISQFDEQKLEKVRDAVETSSDEYERAYLRAERELSSLYKKLSKLSEKFSEEELKDVSQLLEEKTNALQQIKNNLLSSVEDTRSSDSSKDNESSETDVISIHSNSGAGNKEIKKFARDLKNFESFQLKNVRKYNESQHLNAYSKEIYEATKRFKKIEDKYNQLESTYTPEELEEVAKTLSAHQDELETHKLKAKKLQETESYLESRAKVLHLMAQYFSRSADEHNDAQTIIDAALNNGFTYNYEDTQTLLVVDDYNQIFNIKNGREAYNKSNANLNDDAYIEAYYLYLDQLIAYDSNKENTLAIIYDAVSIIQDTLFPDIASLADILFYINKLKDQRIQLQENLLDEIVVSDFHANHINQVFFTDQETKDVAELTKDDMKNQFLPGETIRCIAFLDNTYKNIYGKNNRPTFELVNDVRPIITEEFSHRDLDKGYIDFKIVTNGEKYKFPSSARWSSVEKSMQLFTQLPPRIKQIDVKIGAEDYIDGKFPEAELIGKFKIDGRDMEGIEMLKQNLKIVQNQTLENERIPASRMNNDSYENEILDLFNSQGWKENFKRVIITSDDFFAIKNAERIAIARGLYVCILSESSEGCFKQDFTVAQDPIGDNWSKFRIENRGSKCQISCDKI